MFIRTLVVIQLLLALSLFGCAQNDSNSDNGSGGTTSSLVAKAGSDIIISSDSSYLLSASSSVSSLGINKYNWTVTEIISGNLTAQASIENPEQENTNFVLIGTVSSATTFRISLTVFDTSGRSDTDIIEITVLPRLTKLTVFAGSDIDTSSSNEVSLSGSILSRPEEIAKIRWLQVSGEKLVTLTDSNTLTPTLTAPWLSPTNNRLSFKLIVTDIKGNVAVDVVFVNVTNTVPFADPGLSRIALTESLVTLDGSGSKNNTGGVPTSYLWSSIGPNTVTLSGNNTAIVSFTAPLVTQRTDYDFSLTVMDNGKTDTQFVTISVVSELTYNDFGGRYYGVYLDVANKIAFMAKGEGGIGIFDVSVPSNIKPLATFNTVGNAQDILISNNFAYVADQFDGISVVDITNAATPVLATTLGLAAGSRATALAKSGNYLYVAGYAAGLITIKVQNPKTPNIVSTVDTLGKAIGVEVSTDGQTAYVADGSKGIIVYSLSNPELPTLSFSVDTLGVAYDMTKNGDYLYVADGTNGLVVFDVSNQSTGPVLVNTIDTDGEARKVAFNDAILLLADANKGIKLFDVSVPSSPTLISSYDTNGKTEDLAAIGNNIIVADGYSGMKIVDFSNLNSPIVTSIYTTIGAGKGVSIKGDYAYVADFYNGLIVLDISNPFSPMLASHLSYSKETRGVTVTGNYALIANGSNGLRIVDISDPLNPQNISTTSLSLNAAQNTSISDDGSLAYISGFYGGLFVVDITDKVTPVILGSTDFGGAQTKSVTQLNDVVYVANGDHSFAISDIITPSTVPNTAVLLTGDFTAAKTGDGHDIAVKGNYAYLAHNAAGLAVIDISNSVAPSIVGEYTGGLKSINSVLISGTTLFATNSNVDSQLRGGDDFLIAWDVSTPGALTDTPDASFKLGGQFPASDIYNNYLIMVGESVKVIDVTNPLNPHR